MNKQHIHVGVEDTNRGFERFVETWVRAEKGQITETEVHLNFQDLAHAAIHTDTSPAGSTANLATTKSDQCEGLVQKLEKGLQKCSCRCPGT